MLVAISPLLSAPTTAASQSSRSSGIPPIELRQGLVITRSARIAPGTYRLSAPGSLDSSVITIRGENITVDFSGAAMEGTAIDSLPDAASGVAIRVDGGRNIRIVNARIRGYKVGILARGTRGLALIDNDLSYNWKPGGSNPVAENGVTGAPPLTANEKDDWRLNGSGAYLADVTGGEIRGNVALQGMNGLILVRSSGLRVWNNTFSFNSGVGIGLYKSSNDTIAHNHADYVVRSHGPAVDPRSPPAALLIEHSSNNVVAYNSMTHGGNGAVLRPADTTVTAGAAGSNDNLFYMNDFSFAAASAIEAASSRNAFIRNYIEGAENGLSGNNTVSSRIIGNRFVDNRTGITLEQARKDLILANIFAEDSTAIQVSGDSIDIDGNILGTARVGVRAANATALSVKNNRFVRVGTPTVLSDTARYSYTDNTTAEDAPWPRRFLRPPSELVGTVPEPFKGGFVPTRQDTTLAGLPRSAIIVDEWGPYDYRSPKLWPVDTVSAPAVQLRTLGPPGRWRVVAKRGIAAVTSETGKVGDTISVTPDSTSVGDWELSLEYTGAATVSPRGVQLRAGSPYRFSYIRRGSR